MCAKRKDPGASTSTAETVPPTAFLSWSAAASTRSGSRSQPVGSASRSSTASSRARSAGGHMGSIPSATHSPCRSAPSAAASMPWPTVWPKLRHFRSPCSRSSAATTLAFSRREAKMTSSKWDMGSPASNSAKSSASAISPIFTASASPAEMSRRGRVERVSVSISTPRGW